jgi:hypothetical protein
MWSRPRPRPRPRLRCPRRSSRRQGSNPGPWTWPDLRLPGKQPVGYHGEGLITVNANPELIIIPDYVKLSGELFHKSTVSLVN